MISLHTNLSSFIVQNNLAKSTNGINQAIERLTTGYKINHAVDNAANYGIATNMNVQLSACDIAADNIAMGMDLLSTAQDTIAGMQERGSRIHALITQARNGTYGATSLAAMTQEAQALISEINRLYVNSEYNGIKLFDAALPDWAKTVKSNAGLEEGVNLNPAYNNDTITEDGIPDSITSVAGNFDKLLQSSVPPLYANAAYGIKNDQVGDDPYGSSILGPVSTLMNRLESTNIVGIGDEGALMALSELAAQDYDFKGKTIYLCADLDMSKSNVDFDPITQFNGTFNGNGHRIDNLNISLEGDAGLFANLGSNSEVKNLAVTNASIRSTGGGDAGILAGKCDGSVKNCYTTGVVDGYMAGGLVGRLEGGSIDKCYSTASVTGTCSGGLVGYADSSSIEISYSTGNVSGYEHTGGFVGSAHNSVFRSVASSGLVSGSGQKGTFLGKDMHDNSFDDIYALDQGISAIGETDYESSLEVTLLGNHTYHSAGYRGFSHGIEETAPQVVVSTNNLQELRNCIDTNDIIGIGDADTLRALAELSNKDYDFRGKTIVLTADIDMNGVRNFNGIQSFNGIFDGNGHTISNMNILTTEDNSGLFGTLAGGSIVKNLAVTNAIVTGGKNTGIIAGASLGCIQNCYTTGTVSGVGCVGGLVGYSSSDIIGCYSSASVEGDESVGGLIGKTDGYIGSSYATGNVSGNLQVGGLAGDAYNITNCYATGNVSGENLVGGLAGGEAYNITNCYATGNVNGVESVGGLVAEANLINNCYASGNVSGETAVGGLVCKCNNITGCYSSGSVTGTDNVGGLACSSGYIQDSFTLSKVSCSDPEGHWNSIVVQCNEFTGNYGAFKNPSINLQVGINSNSDSAILVDASFDFNLNISDLTSDSAYTSITNFINQLSLKSTQLGAAQNRLDSALESTMVQMDNLTSSLSTIRDADIAQVSSQYIRQQILQQAAATLMSTANQSPAIALQLI